MLGFFCTFQTLHNSKPPKMQQAQLATRCATSVLSPNFETKTPGDLLDLFCSEKLSPLEEKSQGRPEPTPAVASTKVPIPTPGTSPCDASDVVGWIRYLYDIHVDMLAHDFVPLATGIFYNYKARHPASDNVLGAVASVMVASSLSRIGFGFGPALKLLGGDHSGERHASRLALAQTINAVLGSMVPVHVTPDASNNHSPPAVMYGIYRGNSSVDVVRAAINGSGQHMYVSKTIDFKSTEYDIPIPSHSIISEVCVHYRLACSGTPCPFVLPLMGYYTSSRGTSLLMAHLPGSFERIFSLPVDAAFIRQRYCELHAAVVYLHAHGVAHRDIKGANIRHRADGRLVLIDLGSAGVRGPLHESLPICTVSTRPPEIIDMMRAEAEGKVNQENTAPSYNAFALDAWSLGAMLLSMASGGTSVFGSGKNTVETEKKILNMARTGVRFTTKQRMLLGDLGMDLVLRLMHPDPAQRLLPNHSPRHKYLL